MTAFFFSDNIGDNAMYILHEKLNTVKKIDKGGEGEEGGCKL